ncbi:hypothetical protein AVEN_198152-1 [Araneus ventricosus]|uniref:Uncharacterized protein n=1 Tax=Araneus ventricosus TaxID=182803 RepID=A0A4Y2JDE8_ARAVE|nr:hypothetical protein AVEN_198152-1 [Araneus ventricosus]
MPHYLRIYIFFSIPPKKLKKIHIFWSHTYLKESFLMSATMPYLCSLNLRRRLGISSNKLGPDSKHRFSDGDPNCLAEASKTGRTFVVPCCFTTGLWGK